MKNFLRFTIVVFAITAIGFAIQSSLPKEAAVVPSENLYTHQELQNVLSLGFINAKPVYEIRDYDAVFNASKIDYYKNTYGLVYFSEQGIQNLCNKHDLIMGEPRLYIGDIPKDVIATMNANAEKIAKEDKVFEEAEKKRIEELKKSNGDGDGYLIEGITFSVTDQGTWASSGPGRLTFLSLNSTDIFIIAPRDHFTKDNATEINRKLVYRDPIVVRKVHDGYVQLARW